MKDRVLIALCGMSPAVITETVYALAEVGACPAKVIVITTTPGKEKIRTDLFESGIWLKMLKKIGTEIDFGMASYNVRLIPKSDAGGDAEDILTTSDNARAADFILDSLREFTENPDTEIIFSIAGGRKTMSVLGSMAMSLLGRENDRLCHVLVNPPFENSSLTPQFFFPEPEKVIYRLPGGAEVSGKQAKITLCDIPFTRLRYLFQNEFERLPGSFNSTVELANERISERIRAPELKIIPEKMGIFFNDKPLKFNCQEFVMYWMLAERCRNSLPYLFGQASLREEFANFAKDIKSTAMPEIIHHREKIIDKTDDDVRKIISAISRKIKQYIPVAEGKNSCLPSLSRGVYSISLPVENIIIF